MTYMTTCSGPQLQYAFKIIHISKYSYIPYEYITEISRHKVPVGTLQNITELCLSIKADYFHFLMFRCSNTYHINVCMHRPVTINERDTTQ